MNEQVHIHSLSELSFDALYLAHSEAFKGYPVSWTKEEHRRMLHRRGYDPSLSFGAFCNGQLVAFTLNGFGLFNGISSAYDIGSGTIEAFRGRGLAGRIFEFAAPLLKAAGAKQYVLEVLQENAPAISVYKKQGFTITRSFDCFRINTTDWQAQTPESTAGIELRQIDFSYLEAMQAMIDIVPSWQNSFESLLRKPDDFITFGAFSDSELVGYGIIEPEAGDIPQLVVKERKRQNGIGNMILAALQQVNKAKILKIINVESEAVHVAKFILSQGIPKFANQFEMIKVL